jgi:hypothetical protein
MTSTTTNQNIIAAQAYMNYTFNGLEALVEDSNLVNEVAGVKMADKCEVREHIVKCILSPFEEGEYELNRYRLQVHHNKRVSREKLEACRLRQNAEDGETNWDYVNDDGTKKDEDEDENFDDENIKDATHYRSKVTKSGRGGVKPAMRNTQSQTRRVIKNRFKYTKTLNRLRRNVKKNRVNEILIDRKLKKKAGEYIPEFIDYYIPSRWAYGWGR